MLVAQRPQAAQEFGRRRHIAALAQDRLDDDRRRLLGGRLALEQLVQLLETELDRLLLAPAKVVAVGKGCDKDAARQRLVVVAVGVLGGRHGHGLVGPAVEAALEDDQVAPVRRHARQLDRGLDRLRPAVGEKEPVDGGGVTSFSFSASATVVGGTTMFIWPKMRWVACSWIACTTRGWQCPVLVTPIPEVKSVYRWPAASYRYTPSPAHGLHLRHMGPNGSQQINRVAHHSALLDTCAVRSDSSKRNYARCAAKPRNAVEVNIPYEQR